MKVQINVHQLDFAVLQLEYLQLTQLHLLLIPDAASFSLLLGLHSFNLIGLPLSLLNCLEPVKPFVVKFLFLLLGFHVDVLSLILVASLVVEEVKLSQQVFRPEAIFLISREDRLFLRGPETWHEPLHNLRFYLIGAVAIEELLIVL